MLLGLMSALLLVGGQALGGRNGLYLGLLIAVVMNFFSYFSPTRSRYRCIRRSRYPETENPEIWLRVGPMMQNLTRNDGYSDAEALGDSGGFAERVRDRTQSDPSRLRSRRACSS